MIQVTVDLVPFGVEKDAHAIATIKVWNEGMEEVFMPYTRYRYEVNMDSWNNYPARKIEGWVLHQRKANVLYLLHQILDECLL